MPLNHVFTNAIPDGTNTDIVRPSDWNSAHLQQLFLSGNTVGVSSLSGTNIVIEGGANATVSGIQGVNAGTVRFSGGAGAAGNTGYLSVGANTASLGTIVFDNSNGVSFGLNGQTLTASHNGLTSQSVQTQNMVSVQGSTGNITFSNANGVTFGFNASTITASHNGLTSQSGQAFSAQGGSSAFQTLSFANSNGITFSNSNGSVVASHNGLTQQSTQPVAVSGSNGSFAFSTLSMGNSNGLSFYSTNGSIVGSYTVPTQSTQPVAVSGSNGSFAFSTLSLGNSNGLSFYSTNGSIVGSYTVPAGGANWTVSDNATSITVARLAFTNLNGLTLSLSTTTGGSATVVGSYTVPTVPAQISVGNSNLGNTQGDTGVVTGRVVFVGTNNITLSGSTNAGSMTISISGGAGAAGNTGYISAGAQTASLGTVVFSNSNGVSFGVNGQTVTASHNGLTQQSTQPVALSGSNGSFAFSTATFGNSNGASFYSTNGSMVVSYTVPTVTNSAWTASDSATSGTVARLAFTNLNGVTLSLSTGAGGSHTIVGSHNALTSQSNQNVTAANGGFAFQTLSFSNANGISFGTSAGSAITASHNALTTARASNDAIGLNTAASNVTWTVNSSGLSFDARGYAGTGTTFAGANISGSMTVNSVGVNLSFSVNAGGAGFSGGVSNLGNTAGSTGVTGTRLVLVGSNNCSLSQSTDANGATVSINAAGGGAGQFSAGVSNLGNTAGSTGITGTRLVLVGTNGVSLSQSTDANGGTISFSAGGGGATSSMVGVSGVSISTNGSTISVMRAAESYFAYPRYYINSQTVSCSGSSQLVWPVEMKEVEAISYARMAQTVSIGSMASIGTTANTTFSFNQAGSWSLVAYTRGVGASSLSLQSVGSTSATSRMSINVQAGAVGSNWSVTHAFTWPASNGTASFSTSYATTLTNINISTTHLTAVSGMKFFPFAWTTTFQPEAYWFACVHSATNTTQGAASLSNMRLLYTTHGMSQMNLSFGEMGSAANNSIAPELGLGSFSTNAIGSTASIALANVSSISSHIIPFFSGLRVA